MSRKNLNVYLAFFGIRLLKCYSNLPKYLF